MPAMDGPVLQFDGATLSPQKETVRELAGSHAHFKPTQLERRGTIREADYAT
jgi:hypothetical protein